MRRLLFVLVCAAALAALSLPFDVEVARAATPTLTLIPSSGDPPSVTGNLEGDSWICDSGTVPIGTATASGTGVFGSANIDRFGRLSSGSFTIRGNAGDVVTVTLKADVACISGRSLSYKQQTATFTFNAPPTPAPTNTRPPTATRTPVPTSTPTPLPATVPPPPPTDTPAPGVTPPTAAPTSPGAPSPSVTPGGSPTGTPTPASQPPPGEQFLLFDGCTPASDVSLEFVPLYLVGIEPPDPKTTGPGFAVPAVQMGDGSGLLAFKPPDAEPGRLFRVTPKTDDGDCAPEDGAAYWLPGGPLLLQTRIKSENKLEICLQGDKTPCEYPEVKGAFIHRGELPSSLDDVSSTFAVSAWGVDTTFFAEDLTKQKQRFRSTTDLEAAGSAKLQASVWPFPKGAEPDPENVPGLVASWDISCVNCEFTVDLSVLAPKQTASGGKAWYKSTWDVVKKPFTATGSGIKWTFVKIGNLVGIGGGDEKSSNEVVKATNPQLPGSKPGDYLVGGAVNPLLQPTTYYFRLLVPLKSNTDSNAATNAVRMQQVDKPPAFKFESTPTTVPTESPYEVVIAGYHGILPPLNPNKVCFIATQDAWPKNFLTGEYTTDKSKAYVTGTSLDVHKGDLICQPDPKEPNILEKILSWAEYVIDWTSQAWTDLKNFAVDVVLKYTPLGALCTSVEKSGSIPSGSCTAAFNVALDAALLAAGVPPDIPNFHDLVDQGIDYVAAQAAAQVGIPPEVVKAATEQGGVYAGAALDYAEEQLRQELQDQIKAKLGNVAKSIELANAAAVAWVPDGIPVRPDDYLPPAMTVIVKRKPGVPGGENGCTLKVSDTLKLSKDVIDNPLPGYEWIKTLPHQLSALQTYDLFADEVGLDIDKSLPVPPLAAGESFTVPMTFRPDYYHSGWTPNGLIKTSQYISVWWYLHNAGTLHASVFGSCGSAKLDVPAKASILGAQVVP